LKFFKDNSLEQYNDIIEQYFTTDVHTNMATELENGANTVELIPNGKRIKVTDENKEDFIRKKCYYLGYQVVSE
jgi:hypothetical protein